MTRIRKSEIVFENYKDALEFFEETHKGMYRRRNCTSRAQGDYYYQMWNCRRQVLHRKGVSGLYLDNGGTQCKSLASITQVVTMCFLNSFVGE